MNKNQSAYIKWHYIGQNARIIFIYSIIVRKQIMKEFSHINDVLQALIWNNRHLLFDGKHVFFKNLIKIIRYVKDLFIDYVFKSMNEIGEIGDEVYKKGNLRK